MHVKNVLDIKILGFKAAYPMLTAAVQTAHTKTQNQ